jgi:hypothetical protein
LCVTPALLVAAKVAPGIRVTSHPGMKKYLTGKLLSKILNHHMLTYKSNALLGTYE